MALFQGIQNVIGSVSGGFGEVDLGSGGDPTQINGNERARLAELATLPAEATKADVKEAARKAGEAKAKAVLLAKLATEKLKEQQALLQAVRTRTAYAGSSMRNDIQLRKSTGGFITASGAYALDKEVTQSGVEGYRQHLASARSSLSF